MVLTSILSVEFEKHYCRYNYEHERKHVGWGLRILRRLQDAK